MNQAITALVSAIIGVIVGAAIVFKESKPIQEPAAHIFTYQIQLTNGASRIGSTIIQSKVVDEKTFNSFIGSVQSIPNAVPGGVVLLNCTPIYK